MKKVQRDVEESRARKYVLVVIIYTIIMVAIIAAAFLLPGGDVSLPGRDDVSMNFSSADFM